MKLQHFFSIFLSVSKLPRRGGCCVLNTFSVICSRFSLKNTKIMTRIPEFELAVNRVLSICSRVSFYGVSGMEVPISYNITHGRQRRDIGSSTPDIICV